jgi:hypothetical protein
MKNHRALQFSLLLTSILFITGLASIPWASEFHPMVQNFLYAVGRLPVIYVVFLIFMGVKDETAGS